MIKSLLWIWFFCIYYLFLCKKSPPNSMSQMTQFYGLIKHVFCWSYFGLLKWLFSVGSWGELDQLDLLSPGSLLFWSSSNHGQIRVVFQKYENRSCKIPNLYLRGHMTLLLPHSRVKTSHKASPNLKKSGMNFISWSEE